jgi:hypothetical protein
MLLLLTMIEAICSSSFSQDDFQCASTVGKSAAALSTTLSAPEIAIQYLLDLQESISFVIPAISGATFLIGVISFRATTWAANRDSAYLDTFVTTTEVFVWTSVATALTAAYSVTYTVSAIESATIGSSSLAISGGKALEILQWMAFAFSSLFALAVRKLIQDIDDSDLRPILPITKRNQTPVKRSLPPPARAKQAPAKPRMARKDSL